MKLKLTPSLQRKTKGIIDMYRMNATFHPAELRQHPCYEDGNPSVNVTRVLRVRRKFRSMKTIHLTLGMFLFTTLGLQRVEAVKCFVCDNGDAVSPNFSCPAEGKVSFQTTRLQECEGKCYIRTRHGHGKGGAVVQRGCLPTPWLRNFIPDGCDIMNSDIWCFCDTDRCNGKRLGEWFPVN